MPIKFNVNEANGLIMQTFSTSWAYTTCKTHEKAIDTHNVTQIHFYFCHESMGPFRQDLVICYFTIESDGNINYKLSIQ